jgi:hypothetical protein
MARLSQRVIRPLAGLNIPTSDSREALGELILATLADGTTPEIEFSAVGRPRCLSAIDRAILAKEPISPRGLRVPLIKGSAKDQEFLKAARQINPRTHYQFHGCPGDDELEQLCAFRWRALDNYSRGQWSLAHLGMDCAVHKALELVGHPTTADIYCAMAVIYKNRAGLGPRSHARRHAWQGDMIGLRRSVGEKELSGTPAFEARYDELIAATGSVLEAVVFVLEQAFEFERTADYVAGHLEAFSAIRGNKKERTWADLEPALLFLPYMDMSVTPGNLEEQKDIAVSILHPLRCRRKRSDPPEGFRWHSVMGFSPLDFLLIYFNECHRRFSHFRKSRSGQWFDLESALYRLALNFLAHLNFDEAKAELAAYLSHLPDDAGISDRATSSAKRTYAEEKKERAGPKSERAEEHGFSADLAREEFNIFELGEESPLYPIVQNSEFGSNRVSELRKELARLRRKGLHRLEENIWCLAFPFPEAWSLDYSKIRPRSMHLEKYQPLVRALDPLYVPRIAKSRAEPTSILQSDYERYWKLAVRIIEQPNPISMCRSFALSPNQTGRSFGRGNPGKRRHKT